MMEVKREIDLERIRSLALRQYMHNDGSGLIFGYDKELIDKELEFYLSIIVRFQVALETIDTMPFQELGEVADFALKALDYGPTATSQVGRLLKDKARLTDALAQSEDALNALIDAENKKPLESDETRG